MVSWSLHLVVVVAALILLLLLVDALIRARAAWRRRRQAQGGVYGVVVDIRGEVLGRYVDPLKEPVRGTRVHAPGSVWTGSDPSDPTAWAWEGRAATEEEALHLANRLRHMHVRLIPDLRTSTSPYDGEESSGLSPFS